MDLLEVLDCGAEELHVVLAGNVAIELTADTLGVTHLTEDSTIGRGDTLDRADGAVGIEGGIHGGNAAQIHVLGSDLAVCGKLLHQFLACDEATLAVGDGNGVDLAHLCACKPGRLGGADTGTHQHGLVATDGVVAQSGAGIIGIDSSILKSRTTIGAETNLNELTQSGVYAVNPNQGSAKPTNSPSGAGTYFGSLIVFGPSTTSGNPVTQVYITSFNTFTVFIRSSWGGNWLGWVKLI